MAENGEKNKANQKMFSQFSFLAHWRVQNEHNSLPGMPSISN